MRKETARLGATLALYGHIGLAVPLCWDETKKSAMGGFCLNAHPIRKDTISHSCAVSEGDVPHGPHAESRGERSLLTIKMGTHTEMSISGRLRITFAALQIMEDRVSRRRSSSGQVSPDAKSSHPP